MKLEQYLQKYRGNKENAFVGAAENSKIDILEDLLLQGVDINSKDSRFGNSALHRAASNGSKKVVEFLLARRYCYPSQAQ
jgi:ankyrin repeat protein